MADAFLESDLSLDIRSALQQVDRLNEAVHRATTDIRVTADVRQVTAAIDAAVDAADSMLVVEADTSRVAAEVTGAVDAADSGVVITSDAAEVTGSINAAVENADTSVAVTGQVAPGLRQGVDSLGDSLDAAATSGFSLKSLLAGLSVGAAVAGLRKLADAASDLQESTSKAQTVFGDQFDSVQRFAEGAAESTGLAAQEALEATATFGNLFQALGTSREEAARMSPEVVQLAGDLASFNNIGVDEALEKLRSGLVGEIEPLRSLGVSFLAADVQAKALELGLGDVNGALTEGEKVQARYALIQEQTSLASGDYARTAEGLANQQRTLSAEFGNAAAQAGTFLLPAFLALVEEGRNAIPSLQQLAENVLPALGSAMEALAPLFGTTLDILVALSPIIQVVATAIGLVPAPVMQVVGALVLLNRTLVITQAIAKASMFTGLAGGLSKLALPAGTVAGAFNGVAAGATGMRAGLASLTTGLSGATAAAGLGFAAFTMYQGMMADAKAEGQEFGRTIREDVGDLGTKSMSELTDLTRTLDEQIVNMAGDIDDSFLGRNGVNRDYNASLREGISQMEQLRAEAIEAQKALRRMEAEAEFGDLIKSVTGTGDAIKRLRESAPGVASDISALRLGAVEPTRRGFLDLALSINDAALTEEQMADAAALLGVDVGELQAITERAGEALNTFVSTAIGQLPTLADAFQVGIGQGAILQVHEFIANLDASRETIVNFRDDLAVLAEAGFGDIAGVIAEQGPEVGGALAKELVGALEDGNVEVLDKVREATQGFNAEWLTTAAFFRDTIGPEFILTSGLLGEGITAAFGSELSFSERLRIAAELAQSTLSTEGQAIAAIAAAEGDAAARDYGRALDLDQKTIDEAVKAGRAIKAKAPTKEARDAGYRTGDAFGEGLVKGVEGTGIRAAAAGTALVYTVRDAAGRAARVQSPSKLFAELGANLALGIAEGIGSEAAAVVAEAEAVVRDAYAGVAGAMVDPATVATPAGTFAAAAGAGTTVTFAPGSIVVRPPEGMTREQAAEVGAGIMDGAALALEDRHIAVLGRMQ